MRSSKLNTCYLIDNGEYSADCQLTAINIDNIFIISTPSKLCPPPLPPPHHISVQFSQQALSYLHLTLIFCFRNHQNDLENIPAFVLAAILYTITNPDCQMALWHFRVFTISRILHTFAFQSSRPQPLRGLTFLTGVLTTGSMLVQSLIAVC